MGEKIKVAESLVNCFIASDDVVVCPKDAYSLFKGRISTIQRKTTLNSLCPLGKHFWHVVSELRTRLNTHGQESTSLELLTILQEMRKVTREKQQS